MTFGPYHNLVLESLCTPPYHTCTEARLGLSAGTSSSRHVPNETEIRWLRCYKYVLDGGQTWKSSDGKYCANRLRTNRTPAS